MYSPSCSTWSDGVVTMATGEASFSRLGDILAWNNATATPVYPGQCGQLRGTAAGFLHPDPDRQFIDYFSTDICRPIRFRREGELPINGVDSIKFNLIPKNTFGNVETNPENVCP